MTAAETYPVYMFRVHRAHIGKPFGADRTVDTRPEVSTYYSILKRILYANRTTERTPIITYNGITPQFPNRTT